MPKRFTDTDLWEEDWFIDLPYYYKMLYQFIKDKCSHSGVWRPNIKKAAVIISRKVNLDEFFSLINKDKERIIKLANGRWFLVDFIPFQYGKNLNMANRVHKSIYEDLLKNNINMTSIRGQIEVKQGAKDKDKEKDKEKENKGVTQKLIAYFCDRHINQTGVKYPISYGKDNALMYSLIETYEDENMVKQLIDKFFSEGKDPKCWWADKLSIGVFKSMIPNIIGAMRK